MKKVKNILICAIFLLCSTILIQASPFKLGVASSMSKLRKDSNILNILKFDKTTIHIDMAKDETESFQVVLIPNDVDLKDVSVMIKDLDKTNLSIDWFEIGVAKTGKSKYSELEENWIYDVLFTKEKVDEVKFGEFQPLWIRIKSNPNSKSGNYKAKIVCSVGSYSIDIELKITVRNFTLPRPGTLAAPFGSYKKALEKWYYGSDKKLPPSIYMKWADLMAEYRLTPKEIGTDYIEAKEQVIDPKTKEKELVSLDLGLTKSMIKDIYPDYSYGFYRLPVSSTIQRVMDQNIWTSDPKKLVRQMPDYWKEWIKQGLPEKVYIYGIDEPNNETTWNASAAAYKEIKKINPSWKIMQTSNCNVPKFVGLVDIWCPKSNIAWQPFFQQRLAEGDILWQYVCVTPTFPCANLFIDEPGTNHRNLFWQTRKIGATGFLYWATIWADGTLPTAASGESAFPDVAWDYSLTKAKNGDGILIYPGKDFQPIPSVRLEIVRDGIEDYEYFQF